MKKSNTPTHHNRIWIVLLLILLATVVLSFLIGRYAVSVSDVWKTFLDVCTKQSTVHPVISKVILQIRLPRILLALVVGSALSIAGCAYQTVFHNPMASPDILGASSGACFGAALAILFGLSHAGIIGFAFLFGLSTVLLVYLIHLFVPGKNIVNILLAGIIVGSLFSSATSYIKLVADPGNQLPEITYWLMGSLAGADNTSSLLAFIVSLIGFVPLFCLRWRINLLTCPDEEAEAMGVNIKLLRLVVILCATLLTATCVSFSGMIGWVGLAVPHFCRRLCGNNLKTLLPVTLLSGAEFLLIIDNISRNLLTAEIPIGILTAFIGAPFFVFMLIKGERS